MKIIIAGSRTITDKTKINAAIFRGINRLTTWDNRNEIEIVSGGARGVDIEGENWAKSFGFPIIKFLPDWNKFGKRAGFIRNKEMVDYADALVAIWDGKSKGTEHTINLSKQKGIPYYIELIK